MKRNTFQKIVNDHKDRVFSYALYLLKRREDAEDVTQEVFLKLWKNSGTVEPNKRTAWIMRVTHNASIDILRRKSSRRQTEYNDSVSVRSSISDYGWGDPEYEVELDEKHRALMTAMESLPPKVRSMLLLHYFDGMKYEEIAEALDLNLSAVKVAVHRGRKSLRELLVHIYPEREGKLSDECEVREN